jgi:hypothetical protein
MVQPNFQTVQLARGKHDSPEHGVCVMELASMLAGEPFTDHPKSVCPVIAAFLRGYNDSLCDTERRELYPYAAMVIGSASPPWARGERARRLIAWARPGRPARFLRVLARLGRWAWIAPAAVEAAVRIEPDARPARVSELLESLLQVGGGAQAPATRITAPAAGLAVAERDDRADPEPPRRSPRVGPAPHSR